MLVYRLSKAKYAGVLDGTGTQAYGGRWNEIGTAALYTAQSRSLAILETLVHVPNPYLIQGFAFSIIQIDASKIADLSSKIPKDWSSSTHLHLTKKLGSEVLLSESKLGFKVPSVIVQGEFNYVLNPNYVRYNNAVRLIGVEEFHFDNRFQLK